MDKPPQTFRYKCNYQCTKERGMKMLNELFEPDTHLEEGSDGSRILAPLNRLNISEKEKEITGMG